MSTFTITWVNNVVNGRSIKVLLAGDTPSEVVQWAWVPADLAPRVRDSISATEVKLGSIETEYTDKDGQVVALKSPRQQVSLFGSVTLGDPIVAPTEWVDTRAPRNPESF